MRFIILVPFSGFRPSIKCDRNRNASKCYNPWNYGNDLELCFHKFDLNGFGRGSGAKDSIHLNGECCWNYFGHFGCFLYKSDSNAVRNVYWHGNTAKLINQQTQIECGIMATTFAAKPKMGALSPALSYFSIVNLNFEFNYPTSSCCIQQLRRNLSQMYGLWHITRQMQMNFYLQNQKFHSKMSYFMREKREKIKCRLACKWKPK